MINGFLDGFRGREVYGWACAEDGNEPVLVDLLIDGTCVGRVLADGFRDDLRRSGVAGGRAGFAFKLADRFCDGKDHKVDARIAGSDRSLTGSPQDFTFGTALKARQDWCMKSIVLSSFDNILFSGSLFSTRKLAIYATYHRQSTHLFYHSKVMKSLVDCGFTVLVVHATDDYSDISESFRDDNCFFLRKRNVGYDFGSYATGFMAVSGLLEMVDELIFINDSVVQITPDLWSLLQCLRAADADVVACTESFERQYHLQSYLLWLNKDAISSATLAGFMVDYSFTSVKEKVITEGEIEFSRVMQSAGFRLRALYEYPIVAAAWLGEYNRNLSLLRNLAGDNGDPSSARPKTRDLDNLHNIMLNIVSGIPTNPSHFFWDVLIDDFGFPFIKRELIVVNPCAVPTYAKIAAYIARNSETYESVYGMIRAFGGVLVPCLVSDVALDVEPEASATTDRKPPLASIGRRAMKAV